MRTPLVVVGLFVCLTVAVVGHLNSASAENQQDITAQVVAADTDAPETFAGGKCSFNSDCKYGKCKGGKCGACGFNSDCKGYGKCKSGQCGACGFDSDCKGFGKCSGGRCTKSPW